MSCRGCSNDFTGSRARRRAPTKAPGIGLALVQELVKLHGGSIDAESQPGRGTTFRVRIPFGDAHLPAERAAQRLAIGSTAISSQAFVQEALRWLPDGETTVPAARKARASRWRRAEDHRFASTFGRRIVLADDNADMRGYVTRVVGPDVRDRSGGRRPAGARGGAPRAARR